MKQRGNLQRSIADDSDLKLLNEVELEIAKMKMLQLNAACGAEEQQGGDAIAGERAAVSRMRWLAMQMLQFPVPRHSFAPNLGMMEMYVR